MASRRWSMGRVLLIWCSWPILLIALLFALVMSGGGFSLDLLHTSVSQWLVGAAFLLGPPLLATLVWGRR